MIRVLGKDLAFRGYENARYQMEIKEGIILRIFFLKDYSAAQFFLVWSKSQGTYIDFFLHTIFIEQFNQLNEDNQIHYCPLDGKGWLYLAKRYWMKFTGSFIYGIADVVDIRNPSKKKAFVSGAAAVNQKGQSFPKTLSCIYQIPQNSIAKSFEKGDLYDVFDTKVYSAKIRRNLSSYIISGYKIEDIGGRPMIFVCNYRKCMGYFPKAEIEIKNIDGEFRFIKFVKNEDGLPILDKSNNSLIIDLRENTRKQIKEKCSDEFAGQILGVKRTEDKIAEEARKLAARGEDLRLKSIKKNHSALYCAIKRKVRGGWNKFLEDVVFNYGDIVQEFIKSRELSAMGLNKRIYKAPARDRYLRQIAERKTIRDTLTNNAKEADISVSSAHRFLLEIKEYASSQGKSVDIEPKVGRPPVLGLLEEWARRRNKRKQKKIWSLPGIAEDAGVG
ncbi:MAG TPA: hypothetical protein DEA99_08170, partial [Candidatus Omnitrophica bacterium]|nr:hypothetical protein [Candidatus Omnitrophota bacterium]